MAPGLRRDVRRDGLGRRQLRYDEEEVLDTTCPARFTYGAAVFALVGYALVAAVLIMLVITATFEKSEQDGALCTVLLALWVVVGWCVCRCTVDDMRERERRGRGGIPPTYSRSNLESGISVGDEGGGGGGRGERQPLLGAVAARAGVLDPGDCSVRVSGRAGGSIQVQDDEASVVDAGGSFGTDSDE